VVTQGAVILVTVLCANPNTRTERFNFYYDEISSSFVFFSLIAVLY